MLPIRDTIPRRNPPIATWLLILTNSVVFLFELMMPQPTLAHFFHGFGIVPARFTHPDGASWVGFPINDFWPFLTSMFLHGGWLHIIGNMWMLWIFGDNVEDRMGPVRFLIFYLTCGALAGVTQLLINADSTVPSVGASGAIAGVLGAYVLLYPTARLVVMFPILFFPFFFEVPAVFYLGFWFFSQLFSGTLALTGPQHVGGIAWWAHVGGFVSGMLLCWLFVRRRRQLQPDEYGVEWAWEPRSR